MTVDPRCLSDYKNLAGFHLVRCLLLGHQECRTMNGGIPRRSNQKMPSNKRSVVGPEFLWPPYSRLLNKSKTFRFKSGLADSFICLHSWHTSVPPERGFSLREVLTVACSFSFSQHLLQTHLSSLSRGISCFPSTATAFRFRLSWFCTSILPGAFS